MCIGIGYNIRYRVYIIQYVVWGSLLRTHVILTPGAWGIEVPNCASWPWSGEKWWIRWIRWIRGWIPDLWFRVGGPHKIVSGRSNVDPIFSLTFEKPKENRCFWLRPLKILRKISDFHPKRPTGAQGQPKGSQKDTQGSQVGDNGAPKEAKGQSIYSQTPDQPPTRPLCYVLIRLYLHIYVFICMLYIYVYIYIYNKNIYVSCDTYHHIMKCASLASSLGLWS